MNTTMPWQQLREDHELALLNADLASSSPQSYSLEEKRAICEQVDETSQAIDEAFRADFAAMPEYAQAMMLDLLAANDPANREWWLELLTGFRVPDAPPAVANPSQN